MTSPGVIEHGTVGDPGPGRGQVLLRVRRIGVCGSDVHVYHGKHPFTRYPVVQGHEFSAVVEAVGEGVSGIRVGSLATATPQEVCGSCGPCRRGDYNICDRLKVRGFQAPGVAQDLFVTEADKIVPLPDGFTPEQGAVVEPVAVGVHSTGRSGDMRGGNVVVAGAGPIGNLVAQVCRWRGARVLITDPSDFRLGIARECGIEHVSNPGAESLGEASRRVFGEEGFSTALECAGVEPAMAAVIESVNKGGTIIIVGVFEGKPRIDLSVVGDRELNLVGTLMYRHEDFTAAVKLIASGDVVTAPLDSRHFPFAEYLAAYGFIDEQRDRCMKVFIDL
jgi:L-iditol 2-dehydrogenase/threonine 3-dehydrogenase